MMMMMSTFIAHDSINLNAQCVQLKEEVAVLGGGGGNREKVITIEIQKKKKTHGANSSTEQVRFQTSAERRQGVCFPGCLW